MLKKLLPGVIPGFILLTAAAFGQAPAPTFEVASIKAAPPLDPSKIVAGKFHFGVSIDAQRVDIGSMSLADLIRYAYGIKPYQLIGPDWMSGQRYDVMAKIPDGATKEQVPAMMQALLADRFKLTIHRDSKEHPVYVLVVGKGGPKMKEAAPDDPAAPAPVAAPGVPTGAPAPPPPPPPPPPGNGGDRGIFVMRSGDTQMQVKQTAGGRGATIAGGPMGNMRMSMGEGGAMHMEFAQMTMPGFADVLGPFVDRPVIDMTELTGKYQVALDLSMDEMRNVARSSGMGGMMMAGPGGAFGGGPAGGADSSRPGDAASAPAASSVFANVQKLGLKLDPRKAPVETIVVDHLEKTPTEN